MQPFVYIVWPIKPIKVLKMMKQNYENDYFYTQKTKKAQSPHGDWALGAKVRITSRL
jgi:hypothetical protein